MSLWQVQEKTGNPMAHEGVHTRGQEVVSAFLISTASKHLLDLSTVVTLSQYW
jgi:hypothetical protein